MFYCICFSFFSNWLLLWLAVDNFTFRRHFWLILSLFTFLNITIFFSKFFVMQLFLLVLRHLFRSFLLLIRNLRHDVLSSILIDWIKVLLLLLLILLLYLILVHQLLFLVHEINLLLYLILVLHRLVRWHMLGRCLVSIYVLVHTVLHRVIYWDVWLIGSCLHGEVNWLPHSIVMHLVVCTGFGIKVHLVIYRKLLRPKVMLVHLCGQVINLILKLRNMLNTNVFLWFIK